MENHSQIQDWHALDFFCDNQDSCALTVLIHACRFHIIVDAAKFGGGSDIAREYTNLLQAYKKDRVSGVESGGNPKDDPGHDSGVDVTEGGKDKTGVQAPADGCVEDPETALQLWILDPLKDKLAELRRPEQVTLQDWYHCPTHFYELYPSDNGKELEATEMENSSELERRMQNLIPNITLPKYITDYADASFHNAKDLLVVDESDQPPGTAYHPCRVRLRQGKKTWFLKVVDNDQPNPFKREVDLLNRIKELKLQDIMNVPVLHGLVYFDNADETPTGKKRVMGFLQTDIPEATSLTEMLDNSVSQPKREKWAKEAERIKDVLHEHEVIWGDAKADNFMVDSNDNLWIIDFGGSYTEGWVDPDLNETQEGDDMGTERVVNALIDPISNTMDPDEEESKTKDTEGQSGAARKRAADEDDNDPGVQHTKDRPTKLRRRDGEDRENATTQDNDELDKQSTAYCYCDEPESGSMIACDGVMCEKQWFHFPCAGLKEPPSGEDKWYCESCKV